MSLTNERFDDKSSHELLSPPPCIRVVCTARELYREHLEGDFHVHVAQTRQLGQAAQLTRRTVVRISTRQRLNAMCQFVNRTYERHPYLDPVRPPLRRNARLGWLSCVRAGDLSARPVRLQHLKIYCGLDEPTVELLKFAMSDLNLSARAYDRVLKVARTIADLAGTDKILSDHISEAIQFRSLDRQLWT